MFLLFLFLLPRIALPFPEELIRIRRDVEETALPYFVQEAHPRTGLVRDKARNFAPTESSNRVASLAATGFGLAVIAHGAREGQLSYGEAEAQVLRTLRFVFHSVPQHRGWLLHFVDWETGARVWDSEFSTIDTALFLAGALYAARIFSHPEISELSHALYARVDFSAALTDEGSKPGKRTLSLSYTPERGWTSYQWDSYAEEAILLILGIGHPTRPLPVKTWHAWRRDLMGLHMPLFIHQYSLVFIDFRNFPEKIWNAGLAATFLHRRLGQEGFWGYSAGESPSGYLVSSPIHFRSALCLGCALGSAMFAPEVVMRDVYEWKTGSRGSRLWGKYGLTDSIDVKKNWYSPYVLGITKGPEYLSVQNMEGRTAVWKDFMAIPEVRRAMKKITDSYSTGAPVTREFLPRRESGTRPRR